MAKSYKLTRGELTARTTAFMLAGMSAREAATKAMEQWTEENAALDREREAARAVKELMDADRAARRVNVPTALQTAIMADYEAVKAVGYVKGVHEMRNFIAFKMATLHVKDGKAMQATPAMIKSLSRIYEVNAE